MAGLAMYDVMMCVEEDGGAIEGKRCQYGLCEERKI